MRNLVIAIFGAFALWAGLWVYGQGFKTEAAENWFERQQDFGWIAEYDSLDVHGFPNRYDTHISGLRLADTASGWAWEAPEFDIRTLSYQPNHLILEFPETHQLRTPKESFEISHNNLRGSVVFEPGSDFELNRSTFTGKNIAWKSEGQRPEDTITIAGLALSTRKSPEALQSHDISLQIADANLGKSVLTSLTGQSSTEVESIKFEATAGFRGVWDGPSLARSGPDLRDLDIDTLEIVFSDMRLRAVGALKVDRDGYPSGALNVRAENWQDIVSLASTNGILPSDLVAPVTSGLELVASLSGSRDNLDFTLNFSDRRTFLGPFPLGPAPVIWPTQRQ